MSDGSSRLDGAARVEMLSSPKPTARLPRALFGMELMIRKLLIFVAIGAATLAGSAFAAHRTLDLHDYDDDLMRDLGRTIKYFEPDITGKNVQGALDDAGVLQDGFKYTEDYFTKKGGADDAVQISKDGLSYVAAAVKSVSENDFEAAAEAARKATKECSACHDIYKPLNK